MLSPTDTERSERSSQIFRLFEDPEGAGPLLFDLLPSDAPLIIDFSSPPAYIKGTAIPKERRGKQLDTLFKVRLLRPTEPDAGDQQEPEDELHALIYVMVDLEYEDDEISKGFAVSNIESIFRGETDIHIAPDDWPAWVLPILFCPKSEEDGCSPQTGDAPLPDSPEELASTFQDGDEANGSPVRAFPASKLIH